MADSPGSNLPPLHPRGPDQVSSRPRKTALKISVFKSSQTISQNQFDREMRRLEPRISALELRVESLRRQIPVALPDTFANLDAAVRALQGCTASAGPDTRLSSLDLSALEADLRRNVGDQFAGWFAEVPVAIKAVIAEQRASPFGISLMGDNALPGLGARIAALQESLEVEERRSAQRIGSVDAVLAKLGGQRTADRNEREEVDEVLTKLKGQRSAIGEIEAGIQRVKRAIEATVDTAKQSVREADAPKVVEEEALQLPDLTGELGELRAQFAEMCDGAKEEIAQIRSQTEQSEREQKEATDLIGGIDRTIRGLSEKVRGFAGIVKTLSENADQCAVAIAEEGVASERDLQNLCVQIRKGNARLAAEIEDLQSRLAAVRTTRQQTGAAPEAPPEETAPEVSAESG